MIPKLEIYLKERTNNIRIGERQLLGCSVDHINNIRLKHSVYGVKILVWSLCVVNWVVGANLSTVKLSFGDF